LLEVFKEFLKLFARLLQARDRVLTILEALAGHNYAILNIISRLFIHQELSWGSFLLVVALDVTESLLGVGH